MNRALDGSPLNNDEDELEMLAINAENIQSGLSQFNLKRDIIVYRYEERIDSLEKTVNKFLSTSVSPKGVLGGKPNIAILIPKGSNGAYIELLADEKYRKQREFLLNRKSELIPLLKNDKFYIFELR